MKISVIGCGYLGATHAACMAEMGFEVIGVEVDATKLASLSQGHVPFFEPELEDMLTRHTRSGRLRFTDDLGEAARESDIHFICVGTPQSSESGAADLQYVEGSVAALATHLDRPTLVVGKSTVPVGTAQRLAGMLSTLAPVGAEARLAWSPEFLREGFAVQDTLRPDRLVFGITDDQALTMLREAFAGPLAAGTPELVTDLPTAELVKVAANAFLATKISFINAMAEVCDAVGADVTKLADAIGHDARIGRRFLNAGIGFGGGCLPKDIRAFHHRAAELGLHDATGFLEHIDAINLRQRAAMVRRATAAVEGVDSPRVAVLGAAFKPQSDDIRDSPALEISATLLERGVQVTVHDPFALGNARRSFPQLAYAETSKDALSGADLVLHLTEWPEYRELDPTATRGLVNTAHIIDGRNCLDAAAWRTAGWTYESIGRP